MDMRLLLLVREALDLPPADREAFLRARCTPEDAPAAIALLAKAGAETSTVTQAIGPSTGPIAATGAWPGRRIGAFELVAPLGQGGMGVVWRASRQDGFAQDVAIKWLNAGLSVAARQRFAREREVLARLEHPHIARIVDGGEDGETPWYAMEFVDGHSLGEHVAMANPTLEARLSLFLQLVDAVAYAHQRFIVHRDLKPSNVMVRHDGQAKLLDFGIARLLDGSDQLTGTHAPMTLAYASPEQIRGDPATTATDVYALGAILYEMVTGRRPHEANSAPELMHRISHEDVREPSRVVTGPDADGIAIRGELLRGDLDTIVLKALHRDPERRYPTASAFGDDLRRAMRHEPILARGDAPLYRARKFLRRHRVASAVVAALAVGLVVVAVVALVQRESALKAAALAERNAVSARASTQFLLDMLGSANPWQGGANISVRDLARMAVARVPEALPEQPEARIEIYRSLRGSLAADYPTRDALVPAEAVIRELKALPVPDADAIAQAEYELLRIQMHQMQRLDLAEPTLLSLEQRLDTLSPARQLEIRRSRAYFESYQGRVVAAERIWESLRGNDLGIGYRFDPGARAFNAAQDPSVVTNLADIRRAAGNAEALAELLRLAAWQVRETPPDNIQHWVMFTSLVGMVVSLKPDAEAEAIIARMGRVARSQFGEKSVFSDQVDGIAAALDIHAGRYDAARRSTDEAEAAIRQRIDESAITLARVLLEGALIARFEGDRARMRQMLDEASGLVDPLGRQHPDNIMLQWLQYQRAWLALDVRRRESVIALESAADACRSAGSLEHWYNAQFDLAEAFVAAGDKDRARAIIAAADASGGLSLTLSSAFIRGVRASAGVPEPDRRVLDLPPVIATIDNALQMYEARVESQKAKAAGQG